MKKRSVEEKFDIVIMMLATNTPVAEICRKYNVSGAQAYGWKQKFLEGGKGALAPYKHDGNAALEAENEQLKQLVADLTLANALFKKTLIGRR